ncbi:WG repeat-containing protein [Campylobacter lari]
MPILLNIKSPLQAKLNGKWGFIDKSGKFIIKPIFDEVRNFKKI